MMTNSISLPPFAPQHNAPTSSKRLMEVSWDPSMRKSDRMLHLGFDSQSTIPGLPVHLTSATSMTGPTSAGTRGMREAGRIESLHAMEQVLAQTRGAIDALPANAPDPNGYAPQLRTGEFQLLINDHGLAANTSKVIRGTIHDAPAAIRDILTAAAALERDLVTFDRTKRPI